MKIAILGAGRVYEHYLRNVFTDSFLKAHKVLTYSHSYISDHKGHHKSITKRHTVLDLIKDRPDGGFILTPSGSHYGNSKLLLENGIHV